MNIIIAGVWRSGSTRLYNIVRNILLQNFDESEIQTNLFVKIDKEKNSQAYVAKMHHYDENWYNWSDYVFSTKRDFRDIAASMLDFFNYWNRDLSPFELNFKNNVLKNYKEWQGKSDYVVNYEDYDKNKIEIITGIANLMNLKCNSVEVASKVDSLTNDDFNNTKTLISKNHFSPHTNLNFRERLSAEELKFVEEILQSEGLLFPN